MAQEEPRIEVRALGLEEVTASVRDLARTASSLAAGTVEVAERELAMAVRLAGTLRDQVIAGEAQKEAREHPVAQRFREDVHGIVDVAFDVGTVLALTAIRFVERFVDEPRSIEPVKA